ncbi:MAG: hypothetical protein HY677_03655 [Chloroflexi bacterium]|nr:hypothetical protein [Chloroflexota bacterium]
MRSSSSRWLLAVALVVVLLIAASVTVVLVNPRESGKILSEETPEGIVQRFIRAIQDQDYELAHSYLTAKLRSDCTVDQIKSMSHWFAESSQGRQVDLIDKEQLSRGRVAVRVRITEVRVSPPFMVNESDHQERYVLVQEDGQWRLTETPWPISWCPPPEKPAPAPAP